MRSFIYNSHPGRVIFGAGTLATALSGELERLGCKCVLILSTPGHEARTRAIAAQLGVGMRNIFAGARMHTPVAITEQAVALATELRADGLLAVGGGSTIGLGKAIAFRTDLPQIVVPTTYAGSEMTSILGQTEQGAKKTLTSPKVLPEVVIYDVDLTMTLPARVCVTSGMNGIAHAVEALYSRDHNPLISSMAQEGIRALVGALPRIAANPSDREARSDALYGAWLCGICLGSVGMALHHKLCHTLGGSFDLPHAETHTVVLPHALAYNAAAIPEAMVQLRAVLGTDPAGALHELAGRLGAPRSLQELGMQESSIDDAARRALANPYWNPRPLEFEAIRSLIARAWAGQAPQAQSAL
jgi:maleylacetate reductase